MAEKYHHDWYIWDQPRSVTSDDLRMSSCNVRGHISSCTDLNHAYCPHSGQWQQVPWLKTRFQWKVCRRLFLLWRQAPWPDLTLSIFFLPKVALRMPHKLCKISARSAQRLSGHFRKTHGGCTPLHWRGLSWVYKKYRLVPAWKFVSSNFRVPFRHIDRKGLRRFLPFFFS